MVHHLEYITDASLSALIVRPRARKDKPHLGETEARITRLGGFAGSDGIRVRIRPASCDGFASRTVDIRGEDLYALREFLAELPEEAFVRPADPVEAPERWTEGDVVEEFHGPGNGTRRVWVRGPVGWSYVGRDPWASPMDDRTIEAGLDVPATTHGAWYTRVIRQASGQDL